MRLIKIFILALVVTFATEINADPCRPYYGKGYCTDYVNERANINQRGDGGSWPSNIQSSEVESGDVAIIRSMNHVAYVEGVTKRDAQGMPTEIKISEMNWGSGLQPGTPTECIITSKFNVKTYRTIPVSAAVYMRPSNKRKTSNTTLDIPSTNSNTANSTSEFPNEVCRDKKKWTNEAKKLAEKAEKYNEKSIDYNSRAIEYKNEGDDLMRLAKNASTEKESKRFTQKASRAYESGQRLANKSKNYLDTARKAMADAEAALQNARRTC